ncbi:MAG: TolB family protein, partial [Rhodothermia bacterium]
MKRSGFIAPTVPIDQDVCRFVTGLVAALLVFVLAPSSYAQERVGYYDYMRPDLEWYSVETQHFLIHFHADSSGRGADRSAQVVARIAEDIYGPITSLYEYEPDSKVSIILKDYEDYSNGAAYFFDNKIDIWAPSLASPLRGENAWLRNVITHEFTHIVQVQKTMKGSRKWPFKYVQWLAYEEVRRPDVLYGYPDVIVSYPVPILNNPAWFAEGTAQFQRSDLNYDTWDTHRDMLLRARFLNGEDLSISQMGDLRSKTSLERELVYNQGFAFTTYLANEYGEESLREISEKLGNWLNWTIESAMKDALGEPGKDVFDRWASQVHEAYTQATEQIRANETSVVLLEDDGAFNFSPRFSPDGKRVAYASSKGGDYSRTKLYVTGTDSSKGLALQIDGQQFHRAPDHTTCALREALAAVTGSIDWTPDGRKIVYARTQDTDRGHLYADLFELDLETEKARQITKEYRATSPSYSPDGTRIVFVGQSDGSTNLFIVDTEGDSKPDTVGVKLTHFNDGTQVYSPRWHPDGSAIYFAAGPGLAPGPGQNSRPGNRDIYSIDSDGSNLSIVLATDSDERDPVISPDGKWLYFSTDRTGIFNVNRVRLTSAGVMDTPEVRLQQLTNVVGGAFEPDVSADGRLLFSRFGSSGYQIAVIETPAPVDPLDYNVPAILHKKPGSFEQTEKREEVLALNSYDDTDLKGWSAAVFKPNVDSSLFNLDVVPSKYSDTFSSFQFFPVLRFDMYADADRAGIDIPGGASFQGGELLRNTKVGLYMVSREVLDGLSFSAGLMVGLWSKPWDSFGEFTSPSRFDKLERDVFLRFDYRKGLPFFKKRWAPQLSVEFFNVVRNVENGLAIEEFPCTACFPDTSYVDISYSLWEVDVSSRSKISRTAMLEIGYRYS